MTDEEIIEMAKDVFRGQMDITHARFDYLLTSSELYDGCLTFARAIAARQREIDAGICSDMAKNPTTGVLHSWNCAAAIRGQA